MILHHRFTCINGTSLVLMWCYDVSVHIQVLDCPLTVKMHTGIYDERWSSWLGVWIVTVSNKYV